MSDKKKISKRIFDIFFSFFILVCFSPLFLFIAILIKSTSKGPIFYSSKRVGKNGKEIFCNKFRTMCLGNEGKLEGILATSIFQKQEWETYHRFKNDPRITPIGKFLKKSYFDQLPQFWNVLIGDMSVVGPRPAFQEEITRHYGEKSEKILSVVPGLTGIWQTLGKNPLTIEERVLLEEQYIDEQSFFLDLKLIGKTILMIMISKEAKE